MKLDLELSEVDWLLKVIQTANLPWKDSNPIIQKIYTQANSKENVDAYTASLPNGNPKPPGEGSAG